MLSAIAKLRSEIQAGDFASAEETAQVIDIQLVLDQGKTPAIFSELVEILEQLPDPQCKLGQWLVNSFQWHWKYVPTDDAYELLRLCKEQVGEVRHVGAHQAMAEALEDEHLNVIAGDA